MVELKHEVGQSPHHEQQGECDEGELDVQRPAPRIPEVARQGVDHGEADRPRHHAEHDDAEEPDVARVGCQAGRRRQEPRVGEGHRRDVDGLPRGIPYRHALDEHAGEEQDRDPGLDHESADGHGAQQVAGLAEADRLALRDRPLADAQRVGVAGREQLLPQPQTPADHEAEDRGDREHADPADLDAEEHQHVAERRPVGCHVDGGQAGDAND